MKSESIFESYQTKRQVTVHIVDAFIKDNSGGSPTGVVMEASGLREAQMQHIANAVPASHTAFIFESAHKVENVQVRFFTSAGEIMNCGHGTIAAHFLRAKEFGYRGRYVFNQLSRKGIQQVILHASEEGVEVFFMLNKVAFTKPGKEMEEELLSSLSISGADVSNEYPVILASPGTNRFLLGLKSSETLSSITPDFNKLKEVCTKSKSMGCFVYAMQDGGDLAAIARMFAPNIGVNEDIINGNSSGCLGAYLQLLTDLDQLQLSVFQGKQFGREGMVKVISGKAGKQIETSIGGSAKIDHEIIIEIPEGRP